MLGTDFSASFWMNPQADDVTYGFLIDRRKGEYNDPGGWGVRLHEGKATTKRLQIYSADEKPDTANYDGFLTENNLPSLYTKSTWTKVDIHWKYATNGNNPVADIYTNGVFVETVTLTKAPIQADANIGIGGSTADTPGNTTQGKGRQFNGYMDEVRLRRGVVSADWVKADFDTVDNKQFVTVAPPEVEWFENVSVPGVSHVSFGSFTVAGRVLDSGNGSACSIECKVWPSSGSEPDSWSVLTNDLAAADVFSVVVPNLAALTEYSYSLRVVDVNGVPSESLSGSFTTIAGLTVVFSDASGATGFSAVGHNYATAAGVVSALGEAETCDVSYKVWAEGASEPEDYSALTNGLATGDAFAVAVTGLLPETAYNYKLLAVGDDLVETNAVSGAFTTDPPLVVAWSSDSGAAGLSRVATDFVVAGGAVSTLGGAETCDIQAKVWADGESEPEEWTTLAEGLGLHDAFTKAITSLLPGTAYRYTLRAVGDDGETAEATGVFTTNGQSGETVGSPYTHFFDDGTNACWVANDFERFLPFTVTGYEGTEVLTNFPVLVDIRANDTNGFTYADFYHYDGSDMAFVDEAGHIIPHEIDTWNKNGMSLVWVRLPKMVNGTRFTMCYRSPLVNPPPDPGNTFERYVGVWHMNETQNGVVSLKDSTTNNLPGETHAKSLAGINKGQRIGGNCRQVAQETGTSSSNGRIIVFDHDDILKAGVGNVFTFSGWYQSLTNQTKWAYLVDRKIDDISKGWGIQFNDNAKDVLRVWTDPKGNKQAYNADKPDAGGFQTFAVAGYKQHTDWAYWTFVFSNQTFHAFLNGNELDSTKGGFALASPVVNDENADYANLVIGGQQVGTGAFNGYVDEARYSKGVRSDDWIKAEYASTLQKDTPFVLKGATVSRGAESEVPVVVWERGARMPDTVIDVSYA
ncbi:MAG: DUF2341 domain-containing protein [Kiritimatiellae bacterium]|nr:DUF2341 domain-containing protein [Kiritimatiellia bacterium]